MRLDDAPTKSPITSNYTTTTLVWYLWLHRVGPKKWHFAYVKDSRDRAQLRSYAEWILSMRLDDAPTKSPLAPIYTTTTLVWYLWLHRVEPKKWHFAYVKDSRDRVQLRSYTEWILSMRLDDAPTKSPIAPIYTTTTLVWYHWLHRVEPKKWHFVYNKDYVDSHELHCLISEHGRS